MNTNLRRIGSCRNSLFKDITDSDDGWFKELLFDIKYELKGIWVFIRYDIPCGFRNLIRWFSPVWKDRYWDWGFILNMEYRQLKLMLNRYEKYDFFIGQEHMVGRLKLLVHLIELMDNSDELEENRFINVGNWKRFINNKSEFDPNEWYYRCFLREEKLWNLYNEVRKNTMRRIWD